MSGNESKIDSDLLLRFKEYLKTLTNQSFYCGLVSGIILGILFGTNGLILLAIGYLGLKLINKNTAGK